MNNCSFIGRLTSTPELKTTQSGIAVSTFSIAVDRKLKDGNGERQTDFITIVAWRQKAEFAAKYFTKGVRIGVTGSLQTKEYTDKDGNKRKGFEILADQVYFADGKVNEQQNQNSYSSRPPFDYNEWQQGSYEGYNNTQTAEQQNAVVQNSQQYNGDAYAQYYTQSLGVTENENN